MTSPEFAIPVDFPRPAPHSALAGFQPKLALVAYQGRFYPPVGTPPELFVRLQVCEDLAKQFVVKARECKCGKRAHMSEEAILDQYCLRAMKMGWGSDDEMRWMIRRVAALLQWPVPPSAVVSVPAPSTDA